MRIGFQTWGSEGDVRPLIALADHLAGRGHTVTVIATPLGRIEEPPPCPGRTLRLIPDGPGADLEAFSRGLGDRPSPLAVMRRLIEDLFRPVLPAMEAAARDLAADHDVLVGHFLVHPLLAAARARHRPYVSVCYAPLIVPTAYAPPQALPNLGRWLNPLLWKLEDRVLARMLGQDCREGFARLGAGPAPTKVRDAWLSTRLNLIAASPALCPRPRDWPDHHVLTGEFIRPSAPPPLPQTVAEFLAAGEPPVFLGLGSVQQTRPQDITMQLVEAARCWGGRTIVRSLAPGMPPGTVDGRILYAGPMDHRALFPRCAGVVHHGGAGTSHATARAGVPSVVLAGIDEQTRWGKALQRAGAAPPPLRLRKCTPDGIAQAIRLALEPQPIQAARDLAKRMAGEDGLAEAARRIEALLPG